MRAAVVACGALAGHVDDIAVRNGLDVHVEAIDPLLHNRPERIAAAVEQALYALSPGFFAGSVA